MMWTTVHTYILLWINIHQILKTGKVARYKQEVIEQYSSFKIQRKGFKDVSAQVPLSTAYM